jgi:hypothetical protein
LFVIMFHSFSDFDNNDFEDDFEDEFEEIDD